MSEFFAGCLLGLLVAAVLGALFWRRHATRLSALSRALPDAAPANPDPGAGNYASRAEQWISEQAWGSPRGKLRGFPFRGCDKISAWSAGVLRPNSATPLFSQDRVGTTN